MNVGNAVELSNYSSDNVTQHKPALLACTLTLLARLLSLPKLRAWTPSLTLLGRAQGFDDDPNLPCTQAQLTDCQKL